MRPVPQGLQHGEVTAEPHPQVPRPHTRRPRLPRTVPTEAEQVHGRTAPVPYLQPQVQEEGSSSSFIQNTDKIIQKHMYICVYNVRRANKKSLTCYVCLP